MSSIPDKCRLLHGPYHAPALRRGDRATCHVRGTVLITTWTHARISWPRCRALGTRGGGRGLLLDDELARAVRTEAAAAVGYWWGASEGAVWRLRKALAVTVKSNPRTHALIKRAGQAGADVMKAKEWTEEECKAMSERSTRLNTVAHLLSSDQGDRWKPEELALLGTIADADVAQRTGRTLAAVRSQRLLRGVPNPVTRTWRQDELARLGTATDAAVGARIGRTGRACAQMRLKLGIPRWNRSSGPSK
jgi:hypothetical protein